MSRLLVILALLLSPYWQASAQLERFNLGAMQIVTTTRSSSGGSTVTLTQSNSNQVTATSVTCTFSSTIANGDLVIVNGGLFGSGATVTATSTAATYVHVSASPKNYGPGEWTGYQMWALMTSGESSLTITVSQTGVSSNVFFTACFDYHSTTGWKMSPADGSMSVTGTGSATSLATSITTTGTNALMVSTIGWESNVSTSAQTVASPFTKQVGSGTGTYGSNNLGVGADDQAGVTAGSHTVTFNWTGADNTPGLILSGFDTN